MSSRSTGTLICGTVIVVAGAIAATATITPLRSGAYSTGAATAAEKEQKLGPFKRAQTNKHTEKLRGPLQVRIEGVDPKSILPGEVFSLQGTLASRQVLDQKAEFTWVLPAGVEHINGDLSGEFTVTPEQSAQLEITLRKVAEENVQIHLVSSSVRGGAAFSDTAQFNTNPLASAQLKEANSKVQKQNAEGPASAKVHSESKTRLKIFY